MATKLIDNSLTVIVGGSSKARDYLAGHLAKKSGLPFKHLRDLDKLVAGQHAYVCLTQEPAGVDCLFGEGAPTLIVSAESKDCIPTIFTLSTQGCKVQHYAGTRKLKMHEWLADELSSEEFASLIRGLSLVN